MEATITINGITQTIELTKEQKELFKSKEFGRAVEGGEFYYIGIDNELCLSRDIRSNCDNALYESGNYFLTEEEAEREAKVTSLRRRMLRFSDEHGGDSEWDGENQHWFICYSLGENKYITSCIISTKEFEKVYFNSVEVAKLALDKFKDELMELV